MTDQSDFINYFGPISNDVAQSTGLDPSMVLGTIAQETGWGRHVGNNNPFGISPGGIAATYPSLTDGARAYVDLVNRNYRPAARQNGPDAQAHAMAMLGYNPHPDYGPAVAQRAAEVRDQGFNAPTDKELETMTQKLRSGTPAPAPGTPAQPSAVPVPTDEELRIMTQTLRPPAATTPAATSSPNGPQAENFGIPTGGPATPPPPQPVTELPASDLPTVLGNAYYNGPKVLTPEAQAALEKSHPWLGAITHEGDALLGSGNALWQGTLYGIAHAGDALIPPNSGGSFGRAIAGLGEAEVARRMSSGGAGAPATSPELLMTPKLRAADLPPTTPEVEPYSAYPTAARIDAFDKRNSTPASGRQTDGVDNTQYVPGTATPLTQRDPTPQNIAKYDIVAKNTPAMDAAQEADNAARVDYASRIDTSASTEAKLREVRHDEANHNLREAFDHTRPVDAQPVVDYIHETLTSGINKRPVIAGPLQEVLGRLYNTAADGTKTLESDPETLYHVRQSINDMLDRSNPNNAANLQAKAQLTEIGHRLDKIIEPGTTEPTIYDEQTQQAFDQVREPPPDGPYVHGVNEIPADEAADAHEMYPPPDKLGSYSQYKADYAKSSQPINEIEALRDAGFDDLKNSQGVMTLGRVQKVLDNLIDGVKRGGTNNALSVSDGTWHTLFNLRDDLARKEAIINPTSGNIKPGAAPPLSEKAALENQLRPSLVRRGATYLGEAAADLLSNHLVSGGVLGPFAGMGAGMVTGKVANMARNRLARSAGEAQLNQWTNDLMRMHPDWGGSPVPEPPNPLLQRALTGVDNRLPVAPVAASAAAGQSGAAAQQ